MKIFVIVFFSLILFFQNLICPDNNRKSQGLTCLEIIQSDAKSCAYCCGCCARCSGSTALFLADRASVFLCCLIYGVATRPCKIVQAAGSTIAAWPNDFERFYRNWNKLSASSKQMKR